MSKAAWRQQRQPWTLTSASCKGSARPCSKARYVAVFTNSCCIQCCTSRRVRFELEVSPASTCNNAAVSDCYPPQGGCALPTQAGTKSSIPQGKQREYAAEALKGAHKGSTPSSLHVHRLQALVGRLIVEVRLLQLYLQRFNLILMGLHLMMGLFVSSPCKVQAKAALQVACLEDDRDELYHQVEILEAEKRDMGMASVALKERVSSLAAALVRAEGQVANRLKLLQRKRTAGVPGEQSCPGDDAARLAGACNSSCALEGALDRGRLCCQYRSAPASCRHLESPQLHCLTWEQAGERSYAPYGTNAHMTVAHRWWQARARRRRRGEHGPGHPQLWQRAGWCGPGACSSGGARGHCGGRRTRPYDAALWCERAADARALLRAKPAAPGWPNGASSGKAQQRQGSKGSQSRLWAPLSCRRDRDGRGALMAKALQGE